jgi:hypothetical protein
MCSSPTCGASMASTGIGRTPARFLRRIGECVAVVLLEHCGDRVPDPNDHELASALVNSPYATLLTLSVYTATDNPSTTCRRVLWRR